MHIIHQLRLEYKGVKDTRNGRRTKIRTSQGCLCKRGGWKRTEIRSATYGCRRATELVQVATTPTSKPTHLPPTPTSGDDRHGVQAGGAPSGSTAAPAGVPPHCRPRLRPLPAPGPRLRRRASQEPHHVRDFPLSSSAPALSLSSRLWNWIRYPVGWCGLRSVRALDWVVDSVEVS